MIYPCRSPVGPGDRQPQLRRGGTQAGGAGSKGGGGAVERYGFQCTVKVISITTSLSANRGFCMRTPVRGTGLVYFIGQAAPGEYQGSKTLCLLDTKSKPGRGLGLDYVLRNCTPRAAVHGSSWWWMRPGGRAVDGISRGMFASSRRWGKGFQDTGQSVPSHFAEQQAGAGRQAGDEWVGPRGMVYCWCPPGRL